MMIFYIISFFLNSRIVQRIYFWEPI